MGKWIELCKERFAESLNLENSGGRYVVNIKKAKQQVNRLIDKRLKERGAAVTVLEAMAIILYAIRDSIYTDNFDDYIDGISFRWNPEARPPSFDFDIEWRE